jgi:hypothetical protein
VVPYQLRAGHSPAKLPAPSSKLWFIVKIYVLPDTGTVLTKEGGTLFYVDASVLFWKPSAFSISDSLAMDGNAQKELLNKSVD